MRRADFDTRRTVTLVHCPNSLCLALLEVAPGVRQVSCPDCGARVDATPAPARRAS